jgi:hypothetical protein
MLNRTLGILAILGFTASLAVHLLTYRGYAISDTVPGTWLLHLGVFVVWLPAVLKLNRARRGAEGLTHLLEYIPAWLLPVVMVFGQLIFVSGLVAMLDAPGVATYRDGRYLLVNHGEVLRELSTEEFRRQHALQDRSFSAVWVIFYGMAAMVLFFLPQNSAAEHDHTSLPAP